MFLQLVSYKLDTMDFFPFWLNPVLDILQMKKELPTHRSPLDWGMMMVPAECANCSQTKFLYWAQKSELFVLDTGDLLYMLQKTAVALLKFGL